MWVDSVKHINYNDTNYPYKRLLFVASPPNCCDSFMLCDWTPDSVPIDIDRDHCLIYSINEGKGMYRINLKKGNSKKKVIYYVIEDTVNGYVEKGHFVDVWDYKK